MTKLKERVAYLQGLTKGLNMNDATPEGKVLLNMIDVLDDMAGEVQDICRSQRELETYVETIDEDLNDLEEDIYEDYDPCDAAADEFVEVECPHCHGKVSFESAVLHDAEDVEVTCPYCGDVVYDHEPEAAERSGGGAPAAIEAGPAAPHRHPGI